MRPGTYPLLDAVHGGERPLGTCRGQSRGGQQLGPRVEVAVREGPGGDADHLRSDAPALGDEARRPERVGRIRALHVGRGHRRPGGQAQAAAGRGNPRGARRALAAVFRGARHGRAPLHERLRHAELPAQRHLQFAARRLQAHLHRADRRLRARPDRQVQPLRHLGRKSGKLRRQPGEAGGHRQAEGPRHEARGHPPDDGPAHFEGRRVGPPAPRNRRGARLRDPQRADRRGPLRSRFRRELVQRLR